MTFGEKISSLRKANGMTQEDLGKVLNITYQAVSKWERGESLPDFNTMSQIAKIFKVPLSYFEEDGELVENQESQDQQHSKDEQEQQPNVLNTVNINYVGTCARCGRLLKEGEEYTTTPKVVCKSCAAQILAKKRKDKEELERKQKLQKEAERQKQLGSGFNTKLIVSLVLAAVFYILFTILTFTAGNDDEYLLGFLLAFLPLTVFAIVHVVTDFICELKNSLYDSDEGYTLKLSLIVGAVFAALNLIIFLICFLVFNNGYFIFMLIFGTLLSFTFVSQFMWGSTVKEIFTCGGFTFKMPGFIFSLTVDSILWMIVTKIFLGILSVVVFIVTSILFALIAIFGSIFTFVPCIIAKIVKDKKA